MTTLESQQIATEVDKFPEADRIRMRDCIMQIAAIYAMSADREQPKKREPKGRPFGRRATHPKKKCEVISLAERRALLDRSA